MFFDEFIGSFLLMFVIMALKDDSNKGAFSASGAWFPLGLFFLSELGLDLAGLRSQNVY